MNTVTIELEHGQLARLKALAEQDVILLTDDLNRISQQRSEAADLVVDIEHAMNQASQAIQYVPPVAPEAPAVATEEPEEEDNEWKKRLAAPMQCDT